MYRKQFKSKKKSFTLIEVVVVMGVMGLIIGGLLVSLRQIIEGENLLKKMLSVEEETRFMMDAFAQDAEYSDLDQVYKDGAVGSVDNEVKSYKIRFLLTEKKTEINTGGNFESEYSSYVQNGNEYYLKRTLTKQTDPPTVGVAATLDNTPLASKPVFRVKMVKSPDGSANYFITISIVYRIVTKDRTTYIPVETSAMSRTFEL